ncbi:uncharacterized protein L199_001145 [Kwoniella botswanensis]|uniref:uncharacterized protein n=1 Tax=Kwoniella botswanensis TaxID=1268659 RepID=UPI00315D91F3
MLFKSTIFISLLSLPSTFAAPAPAPADEVLGPQDATCDLRIPEKTKLILGGGKPDIPGPGSYNWYWSKEEFEGIGPKGVTPDRDFKWAVDEGDIAYTFNCWIRASNGFRGWETIELGTNPRTVQYLNGHTADALAIACPTAKCDRGDCGTMETWDA